ncbi:tubulin-specific chaperone e [Ophiostoma piceae UAMH 11346]|uniref:Tubulin-specific chaperone e n=1 Tax=Ophiostoma piceae (strain UAMH 11346) TaxID=1262450 RepID=S3C5U2_OPHP1|nr:tubulin-specific chaperone e [Ophiostoma piceae UAMH 11346]
MTTPTTPVVGQRLSYDGALCTVRYVGEVAGTASGGTWLGVEWDDPTRGKHDGVHKGVRYFSCRRGGGADKSAASFVRPTRPADTPRTFLEAVREKYADVRDATSKTGSATPSKVVMISGKVAEEVGFDKVRRQLAQIETLKVVILDGVCVLRVADKDKEAESIRDVCPSITDLDLSRNLFTEFATVVDICRELPNLRNLRINGNRFVDIALPKENGEGNVFGQVTELGIGETLMSWAEIGQLTANFPALTTMIAGTNQLTLLTPPLPSMSTLPSTLTTLNLEFNDFTALSDLASLSGLHALRNLHLKGCNISQLTSSPEAAPLPKFSSSLQYLDLSYNRVASWQFIDTLPDVLPGMTALRFSHNPIYNSPYMDVDTDVAAASAKSASATANSNTTVSTEESYMIAVGRLGALQALNFSNVTATDRSNAEMFYLSRIAKQLATVTEGSPEEASIIARHRRYAELCELYGEPTVVRHTEINPAFLEARLITVDFVFGGTKKVQVQVPKSFDMYAVKSMTARLFGESPQKLRLVWETGEWDPVGGEDDEGQDDDDEEDDEGEADAARQETGTGDEADTKPLADIASAPGRWIKREVELKDSPRQFGFCVDGMEATIRVEVR